MKKYLLPLLLVLVSLCGCGDQGSKEYLGKWISTKRSDYTLEIAKNDNHYLVKETYPLDGKPTTKSYPAIIKDGIVQVQNGIGTTSFTIVKETGHLTQGSREWYRAK